MHHLRALLVLALLVPSPAIAQRSTDPVVVDPLVAAREAYNAGEFDAAIVAAEAALEDPAVANAAAVVLARARLERYRGATGVTADIEAALEALARVRPSSLGSREYVEYLIGMGEAQYLSQPTQFAAAAEFFEIALSRTSELNQAEREIVFTWWADSLDRAAQFSAESGRRQMYERLLAGAERERSRDDVSAVVWYWLAVAARGVGDIERAWGAAVAAWIRAADTSPESTHVRHELDRFVTQVILPERAMRLSPDDAAAALPILERQWTTIKERWGGRP